MIRIGFLFQHSRHGHDESGSAEATLRTVAVDHRLLDAVEVSVAGETFNGDDVAAVQLKDKSNTRVD